MQTIKDRIEQIGKVYDEVQEEMDTCVKGSPEHKCYCRVERKLDIEDRLYRSTLQAYKGVRVK
jgi:hypothetical protein